MSHHNAVIGPPSVQHARLIDRLTRAASSMIFELVRGGAQDEEVIAKLDYFAKRQNYIYAGVGEYEIIHHMSMDFVVSLEAREQVRRIRALYK